MTLQGIRRALWKNRLLRLPIQNLPVEISGPFQHGIHNSLQNGNKNLLDWNGKEIAPLRSGNAIEFTLPWKFLLATAETNSNAYSFMARYTQWLANFIVAQNFSLIPTINFNNWTSLPPRRATRRISWHSRGEEINSLHLKIGSFPGYVSIDSQGYSGWAKFSGSKDYLNSNFAGAHEHFTELSKKIVKEKLSKYQQANERLPEINGRYVFFPMQMPNDAVAALANIGTLSLLQHLGKVSNRVERTIVVKRHPKCKSKQVSRAIQEAHRFASLVFTEGNIHDIIERADAVITVNSGVGAEALLHRKPVIITGGADYSAAAFNVSNLAELDALLYRNQLEVFEPKLEKFIYAYTRRYMVEYGDESSLSQHPEVLVFLKLGSETW